MVQGVVNARRLKERSYCYLVEIKLHLLKLAHRKNAAPGPVVEPQSLNQCGRLVKKAVGLFTLAGLIMRVTRFTFS